MSNKKPRKPPVWGTTRNLRQLYGELLKAGFSHRKILDMSVSEALLARHGSPSEVDRVFGEGTFWGVKQPYDGKNSWRRLWHDVREERWKRYLVEYDYAFAELHDALESCRAIGMTEDEILKVVSSTKGWVSPWKPPYAA